jgi:hypothetical protein
MICKYSFSMDMYWGRKIVDKYFASCISTPWACQTVLVVRIQSSVKMMGKRNSRLTQAKRSDRQTLRYEVLLTCRTFMTHASCDLPDFRDTCISTNMNYARVY